MAACAARRARNAPWEFPGRSGPSPAFRRSLEAPPGVFPGLCRAHCARKPLSRMRFCMYFPSHSPGPRAKGRPGILASKRAVKAFALRRGVG